MKLLFTVEFYSPSVGGAQEVVKQISEHLVLLGHEVTVATTKLNNRNASQINGVSIKEFEISGNYVNGMHGEIERYQDFLINGKFDVMINYAAQQWTMDAAFPVLSSIPYRKVMIPCGFSGLYEPNYQTYFAQMPTVMKQYDHIVFHASDYRDTNFAKQCGITNFTIIPNGAAKEEFVSSAIDFRLKYKISKDVPIILTVGSHTGSKGHALVLKSFQKINTRKAVLVIIGNIISAESYEDLLIKPLIDAIKHLQFRTVASLIGRAILGGVGPGCLPDCRIKSRWINLSAFGAKRVLLLDPPRPEVVSAYMAADLFLFASNIEYSPLVLFEAAASHTPFITLACGNAKEIVEWTGGGLIAPTKELPKGMVDGDENNLALMIDNLIMDKEKRKTLADSGYHAWKEKFTWDHIASEYKKLFEDLIQ